MRDAPTLKFIDKYHPRVRIVEDENRVELVSTIPGFAWTMPAPDFRRLLAEGFVEELAGPGSGYIGLSSKGFRSAYANDPAYAELFKARDEESARRRKLRRRIPSFLRSFFSLAFKKGTPFSIRGAASIAWEISK